MNMWAECNCVVVFSPFLLFLILKFNSIQLECCCYRAILSCVIFILFKCFFVFQLLLGTLPNCENNKTTATITSGEMRSWVERSSSLSFFSFFFFFLQLTVHSNIDTEPICPGKQDCCTAKKTKYWGHLAAAVYTLFSRRPKFRREKKEKKVWTNPFKERNKKGSL